MTLRTLLTAASLLCFSPLQGCEQGDSVAPPASYALRGQVREFTGSGPAARATIQHEAVPDFKDRSGRVVGMKPMKMAFGVDPAVDTKLLTPDAKLQLTIEVDWRREPALMIKQASVLPEDTALKL